MGKKADKNKNNSILSPKRENFCLQYIKDSNATQAAIRAGYSEKTAKEQGSRLLTNVAVKTRVKELQAKRAKDCGRSASELITKLWELADMEDAYVRLQAIKQLRDIYGIDASHKVKIKELELKQKTANIGNGDTVVVMTEQGKSVADVVAKQRAKIANKTND